MPRPVIACANTVAEGMGIRTESVLTQECRKGVMEFLLINHPLDCPICDQAGECRLQEFSVEHGKGESRFREDKVKKPKNVDIGPRVRLDDERCIMCSRCIRFTAEIADDPVLGFTERGSFTTLAVHPGKRLENNYSLNTVDICPVGALDQQRLPLPAARVVPHRNEQHLHRLRSWLQHGNRRPWRHRFIARPHATTTT
jgi:NADH-quinone oxidoreductase subunit G